MEKIKKTLIFAIITIFLTGIYKKIFGEENTILGMMVGMTSYAFIRIDLTSYPIYKTIIFILLNGYLVISAYFSALNPTIGFILNILNIFSISFIYMREFKSVVSYIFIMSYIFMWEFPSTLDGLDKRFLAITFGSIFIILVNLIVNRKKFKVNSKYLILKSIKSIISVTKNSNQNGEESIYIDNELRKILFLIDERNKNAFIRKNKDTVYFSTVLVLEQINTFVKDLNSKCDYTKELNLKYLEYELNNLYYALDNNSFINEEVYNSFNENNKSVPKEVIELIRILKININNINNYKSYNKDEIYNFRRTLRNFYDKSMLSFSNLGFSYSFKLAVTVSIVMFLVEILNIPQGRWIVTTVYVLIQPYMEDTFVKAKNRFKGTIIGVTLALTIFNFMPNIVPINILMIVIMFYYYYFKNYDKKVICTALMVVSLEAQHGNIFVVATYRFSFIAIGIIIALLVNKYVFPHSKYNHVNDLKSRYIELTNKLSAELQRISLNKIKSSELFDLILNCNFVEWKLINSENFKENIELRRFIDNQGTLIKKIRYKILSLYYLNYLEEKTLY